MTATVGHLSQYVLHHILSVVFLKPTVSIRSSVPPRGSHKCLRFGLCSTLCTVKYFTYFTKLLCMRQTSNNLAARRNMRRSPSVMASGSQTRVSNDEHCSTMSEGLMSGWYAGRRAYNTISYHIISYHIISRTELAKRALAVAAPVIWNSLPAALRHCQTVLTFKKTFKESLF